MNQNKVNYSLAHMLARDHLLSITLLYTILYVLQFHCLEMTVTGNYLVMHTRLDKLTPFLSVFIVPYPLWFIYIFVALLYFSRTDKDEVADLCLFLLPGMTVVLFICATFPNGTDLRVSADPANGFLASLVRMTQPTDTPTNVFLSIHVFSMPVIHITVTQNRPPAHRLLARCASLILIPLICPSTVFLKQCSTFDVFGALLSGYFVNAVVYSSYEVPVLIPAGADALLWRKKNPAKVCRRLRRK